MERMCGICGMFRAEDGSLSATPGADQPKLNSSKLSMHGIRELPKLGMHGELPKLGMHGELPKLGMHAIRQLPPPPSHRTAHFTLSQSLSLLSLSPSVSPSCSCSHSLTRSLPLSLFSSLLSHVFVGDSLIAGINCHAEDTRVATTWLGALLRKAQDLF